MRTNIMMNQSLHWDDISLGSTTESDDIPLARREGNDEEDDDQDDEESSPACIDCDTNRRY